MKHPLIALFSGILLPLSMCAAQNFWQQGTGPAGRTVYALAYDHVSGYIFAGTDSGVYRSPANGSGWTHLTSGLPAHRITSLGVNSMSYDYAGGNDGLFRSTNSGDTWARISSTPQNNVTCLLVNASDQVLFGTDSVNGRLWRLDVDGTLHGGGTDFTAVISSIVEDSSGNATAGMISNPTGGGIYLSPDGGLTWNASNSGLPDTPSVSTLARDSSGNLFAGTPSNGVYRSTDGGLTWTAANGTGSSIGPAGGTVASNDGRLSLQVPAGALGSTVFVSIRPVADSIPSGIGPVYSLTPSGLVFNTPATLTFAYVDSLLSGMSPRQFGVAYKDQSGHWMGITGGSVDTSAKTVSVPIGHFSEWGTYQSYQVVPQQATVLVGGAVSLRAEITGPPVASADSSPYPLYPIPLPVQPNQWLVNGIPYGSSAVGTVSTLIGIGNASYLAPGSMPANDPVAVTAQFILQDLSELDVIGNIEVLAKNWSLAFTRSYGAQCAGNGLWTFLYVDGATVAFSLDNNFQIVSDIPSSLIPSLTGVGACQPGFLVGVTTGNPTTFNSLTGGYIRGSKLFSFNVDFNEADALGITYSYNGTQILQTPVKAGAHATGTFPFPAVNGYTFINSDKQQNLPTYIIYQWVLTTTQ